jgi:hypothetical protein
MILRIVAMKVTGSHELDLTFNNGVRKRVNVEPLLEGAIFRPLRASRYFAQATLDEECGTVVWPNGADFAPETLMDLPAVRSGPKKLVKQKAGR